MSENNKKIEDLKKKLKDKSIPQLTQANLSGMLIAYQEDLKEIELYQQKIRESAVRNINNLREKDKEIEELRKKILGDVRNYIKLINKALKRYNCKLNIYDLEKKLIKRFKEVKG